MDLDNHAPNQAGGMASFIDGGDEPHPLLGVAGGGALGFIGEYWYVLLFIVVALVAFVIYRRRQAASSSSASGFKAGYRHLRGRMSANDDAEADEEHREMFSHPHEE